MIDSDGGVGTAKSLLANDRIQDMFVRMASRNDHELTIEWLVVQLRFGELFTPEEVATARRRLVQAGYPGAL